MKTSKRLNKQAGTRTGTGRKSEKELKKSKQNGYELLKWLKYQVISPVELLPVKSGSEIMWI